MPVEIPPDGEEQDSHRKTQEHDHCRLSANRMEALTDLYKSEGWNEAFPPGVIDIASDKGVPYAVPVNIHRSNVIWLNKTHLRGSGPSPRRSIRRPARCRPGQR